MAAVSLGLFPGHRNPAVTFCHYKDTSHIEWDPHLYDSFNLNFFFKSPHLQKHILRYRGWVFNMNFGRQFSSSVQFSSVTQLCPTLCDPMNRSTPGLPVHQQLPEFAQTHVHRVSESIQPSHPLSSPSSPAPNPSQHQGLFQWVNSSHEVAKLLEFQL